MSLVIPILLLGLLASLSPATIIVFILLLATTRAKVNAAAFLIGWSVSLVVVFSVSYEVGGPVPPNMGAATLRWRSSRFCSALRSSSLPACSGDTETGPRPVQG